MTFSADVTDPLEIAVTRASEWFSPVRMMDVEITEQLPPVPYDGQHPRVWVVGRLHTEPVGVCVVHLEQGGLTPDQLGALLWQEIRGPVTERFAAAGLPLPGGLTGRGLAADPAAWPYLRLRQAVLAAAPFISVIVPTRDREERRHTWLDSLSHQEYPRFEVVVVDNAPTNDAIRTFVDAARGSAMALRYVREPRPGTSWAANAGVAASAGEIITFCADDGEPDRHWLAGLATGFARGDDIGCVTGMVLPARLDTPAQELYEQFGGFRKSRGFSPAVFSRHGPQSPVYPVPPFGTGACVAYRREALERIGGFDVALLYLGEGELPHARNAFLDVVRAGAAGPLALWMRILARTCAVTAAASEPSRCRRARRRPRARLEPFPRCRERERCARRRGSLPSRLRPCPRGAR